MYDDRPLQVVRRTDRPQTHAEQKELVQTESSREPIRVKQN